MKIGELARKTGLTLRTIRYYEELGLIKPQSRSKGGFRLFSEGDISRIELIHYLKCLNLPLNKIRHLLLLKKRSTTKGEVANKILPHLENFVSEAQSTIEKYQKIKDDMEKTRAILKECAECDRVPIEDSCLDCDIMKSNGGHPLVAHLIF